MQVRGSTVDLAAGASWNFKGDTALQGLYGNMSLKSLIISGIIVGVIYVWKGKKWGLGTFGVLTFVTFYLVTGWVVPLINSLFGNNSNGQVALVGNATLQGLLNLTAAGTILVSLLVAVVISKRFKWGIGVGLIMTFVISILWLHWWIPLWHSTGFSLSGLPFT
jgi:hypothetical protein